MFVFAVHVQNYRSLKDVWFFPNKTLNCIIGSNNSGKTTLLSALSYVLDPRIPYYRDDLISQFDYYNCNTANPIAIDIWLQRHDVENNDIVIRAYDKFSRWKVFKTAEGQPDKLEPIISEPLEVTPAIPDSIQELLRVQFKAAWDEQSKNAEIQTVIVDEKDNPIEPFSMSLRKLIGYNSIKSKREPLRDISLNKRGIFSQFLNDVKINPIFRKLINELENNRAELINADGVKQVIERLKKIVATQVLGNNSTLSNDSVSVTFLNSEISKLRAECSFSVKIGDKPNATETESTISIHVPLEYQGEGIQNLFLIIALSEIIKQQAGDNHCIVTIEEPEQHLEPSQIKWVYSELCKSFSNMNNNQLFITSHSPSLIGEIKGVDSLILMPAEKSEAIKITHASYLPEHVKKSFERNKDIYASALLAKYLLVVEGASELGLLPVAFRAFSDDSCNNPFHLGLEIVNGEDKGQALKRGAELLQFNRFIHVLIDHDIPKKASDKTTDQLMTENAGNNIFITCWANTNILPFIDGTDLEVILAKEVQYEILLEAIKEAYKTLYHEFNQDKWKNECDKIKDPNLKEKLKLLFPKDISELKFADSLINENDKQAYLYLLLHEPHSCKSVKEMRIIAEHLAIKNAFPDSVKKLYKHIVDWITKRGSASKQKYLT